MKYFFTILIVLQFVFSCDSVDSASLSKDQQDKTPATAVSSAQSNKDFTINAEDILKDFMTWYTYTSTQRINQHLITRIFPFVVVLL